MDSIIKLIDRICKNQNCPSWMKNDLVYVILGALILYSLIQVIIRTYQFIISRKIKSNLVQDLGPYYSKSDINRATRYFVETRYQSTPPSDSDEFNADHSEGDLLDFFVKKAFRNDEDDDKFYLILSDTGMGKTTFMLNLYLRYLNQKNLLGKFVKYDIELIPLSFANSIERISKIENKKNTILLLDSLDEDSEIANKVNVRLEDILSVASDFREIVITCRTHFFPSHKNEPDYTGHFSAGERGQYRFKKLYISPFSNSDVETYLKKRYNRFDKNREKAFSIISKSKYLSARPMLLSKIDDLLKSDEELVHGVDIFRQFINEWIKRESIKPSVFKSTVPKSEFFDRMDLMLRLIAIDIYINSIDRGGYFISEVDEDFNKILNSAGVKLDGINIKHRSLLNRNMLGQYKFSHRSILEFYLAESIYLDYQFIHNVDFNLISASKDFLIQFIKKGGIESFTKIKFTEEVLSLKFGTQDIFKSLTIYSKANIINTWYIASSFFTLNVKLDSNESKVISLKLILKEVILCLKRNISVHDEMIEKKRILDIKARMDIRNDSINHFEGRLSDAKESIDRQRSKLKYLKTINIKDVIGEFSYK